MKLNWAAWLYGLIAGFIGGGAAGAAAGVSQILTDPAHADVHHLFALMGTAFLVAGTLVSLAFLAHTPLPPVEQTTVVQTTTQPSSAPQTTTTVVKTGTETKP